jgi:hypothetical protein
MTVSCCEVFLLLIAGLTILSCYLAIEIDTRFYCCRDCRQTSGFDQWICEPCFETDKDNMQHKQKHYFIKEHITEDPNLPDIHKERF